MPTCAHCVGKFCRTGDLTNAPKNCPSICTTHEEVLDRYKEDRTRACISAAVEGRGYGVLNRIEEIMEYAIGCGYHHLGVAFCVGLSAEARIFVDILRKNGFEVDSICCKNGGVSKSELGLDQCDFTDSNREFEAMCNPAGQAAALDMAGCELSIICGLCVGHDTLFIKNSKTPVTVLAVKDRVMGHNPLAAIYTADSYRQDMYDYVKNRKKMEYNY